MDIGLSDFHKIVSTFMCYTCSCQEPIRIFIMNILISIRHKFLEDFVEFIHATQPQNAVNGIYMILVTMLGNRYTNMLPKKSESSGET